LDLQRLSAFEWKVLRREFEQTRHKVTGGWRQFYNEELPASAVYEMLLG
jgi:hypothetical protein